MKSMCLYKDNYCRFDYDSEINKVVYCDMSTALKFMSKEVGLFIANKYRKSTYHGCSLMDMLDIIQNKNRK